MEHDKEERDEKRERRARRRAIEKALDGVAKTAREIAEKRIRERNPDLFK